MAEHLHLERDYSGQYSMGQLEKDKTSGRKAVVALLQLAGFFDAQIIAA